MSVNVSMRKKTSQRAVSRILFLRRRPFRRLEDDNHSSRLVIADELKRPTRRLRTGRPTASPYLVLLRAGFCLPPMLPPARCALTAPFHPYPSARRTRLARAVCFLCHFPSSCPDRALPGALPCGVRTFLPRALAGTRTIVCLAAKRRLYCARLKPRATPSATSEARHRARHRARHPSDSSVGLLRDLILLEFLVQIAARGVDHLGGLRDVPPVLAKLRDEKRALGVVLELPKRSRFVWSASARIEREVLREHAARQAGQSGRSSRRSS